MCDRERMERFAWIVLRTSDYLCTVEAMLDWDSLIPNAVDHRRAMEAAWQELTDDDRAYLTTVRLERDAPHDDLVTAVAHAIGQAIHGYRRRPGETFDEWATRMDWDAAVAAIRVMHQHRREPLVIHDPARSAAGALMGRELTDAEGRAIANAVVGYWYDQTPERWMEVVRAMPPATQDGVSVSACPAPAARNAGQGVQ